MPGVPGELVLKHLAPRGFQGMGYVGKETLIMVTDGVSVTVSTDWVVLG